MGLRRQTLAQRLNREDPMYSPLPGEEEYYGESLDIDSVDYRAWGRIGRLMYLGRKSRQISMREAARRAGFSEALWRLLENGGRKVNGEWKPPNPRPENLLAAALAVGQEPAVFFEEAAMELPKAFVREMHDDRLAHKLTHLTERDRDIIERLVDSMLDWDRQSQEGDATDSHDAPGQPDA